jgi:hypothetical protein
VKTSSGAHIASYPMGTRGSFPGGSIGRGVKLTTHLHLVPRSIVCSYTSNPQYTSMACCSVKAKGHLYLLHFPGALSPEESGRFVKLTAHLNLISRLRILRAIPPLPHTSSCPDTRLLTGTNSPLHYIPTGHVKKRQMGTSTGKDDS